MTKAIWELYHLIGRWDLEVDLDFSTFGFGIWWTQQEHCFISVRFTFLEVVLHRGIMDYVIAAKKARGANISTTSLESDLTGGVK